MSVSQYGLEAMREKQTAVSKLFGDYRQAVRSRETSSRAFHIGDCVTIRLHVSSTCLTRGVIIRKKRKNRSTTKRHRGILCQKSICFAISNIFPLS